MARQKKPAPSDRQRLAAQVQSSPGDWQVRLVYADLLAEQGDEANSAWQREIADHCQRMDAGSASRLNALRTEAAPIVRGKVIADTGGACVEMVFPNRSVTERMLKTMTGELLTAVPEAVRRVVRQAALEDREANTSAPGHWSDLQSQGYSGHLDRVPVFREALTIAWPRIAALLDEDDAARLARYQEFRTALAAVV